jgi:hypothetical protein
MAEQRAAKERSFSSAFQQMASFVAIAKTANPSETREQLILQCFVVLPQDRFACAADLGAAIDTLFGLQIPEPAIEASLRKLTQQGLLLRRPAGHLGVSPNTESTLSRALEAAKQLEDDAKRGWTIQVQESFPRFDYEKAWQALRTYLRGAFRRHGIQAAALLDPAAPLSNEHAQSLSGILRAAVQEHFPSNDWPLAAEVLASFFETVRLDRRRAEYIALLADGAYNYFSLMVAPEVSDTLREKLSPLTLFLDTNFLFGLLKLHVNPQVDVSEELLSATAQFHLPFKLRYHEATVREMSNTLHYYGVELKKRKWPQSLSRAAVASGNLSGIELRFHEANAKLPLEPDDFFAPFQHWQVLLKDKGIDVYRAIARPEGLERRADLEAEYKDFLARQGKEKAFDAIQHDMAVLETVWRLRTNASSTLEAGALLVTQDYFLFRFDWERTRSEGQSTCTVLPNLLWQMLRPYVSDHALFDKAFAETFALPEFSSFGGGAASASSRMLSILAGYNDVAEETATKMLSNDFLIAQLQTKTTDTEFVETVESAFVSQNAILVEEKAAMERELKAARLAQVVREEELTAATDALRQKQEESDDVARRLAATLRERDDAILSLSRTGEANRTALLSLASESERSARERAEAERKLGKMAAAGGLATGVMMAGLFVLIINYVVEWPWLNRHPNGLGIETAITLALALLPPGAFVPRWRKWTWGAAMLAVVAAAIAILGPVPRQYQTPLGK